MPTTGLPTADAQDDFLRARRRRTLARIATALRRDPGDIIDVFRVGEAHFVRDGHHRVSVARAQGDDTIDARVVEVLTRVGADRGLRVTRPAREGPRAALPRAVPLPPDARVRITLSDPWRFGMLAEGVEAWGFRLMHRDVVLLDREEVARRWYAEEYRPVVALLLEATLFDPRRETEADAYLRLSAERYRLMRTQAWSDEVIERLRRG